MALPQSFLDAVDAHRVDMLRWIEIEGIPNTYGYPIDLDGSFFAARPEPQRFFAMRAQLVGVPDAEDQELDPLDGIAERMGQVSFVLGDHDGEPTRWTSSSPSPDWMFLREDHFITDTVLYVDRTPPVTVVPGSYLYLGPETVKVIAVDGPSREIYVERGKFRSSPRDYGRGFPVAPAPYVIGKRRVWYFQAARRADGSFNDADKIARFVGTIEGMRLSATNLGAYTLDVRSLEKTFNKEVFSNFRTFTDTARVGITGLDGLEPGLRPKGWPGFGGDVVNANGHMWAVPDIYQCKEGEWVYLRIDDEIFLFERAVGAPWNERLHMRARALFGTVAAEHEPGFVAMEVAPLARFIDPVTGDTSPEHNHALFKSTPTSNSPLPADHPLIIILQVLLSTGKGTNVAPGRRNYDVLPESFGLGVDVGRVDIPGIEAAAMEKPGLRASGIVEEAVNFIDFARNMMRPLGYYALVTLGDQWVVKSFRLPYPDEVKRPLGPDDIISGRSLSWDANIAGTVRQVEFKSGLDIVTGNYMQIDIIILRDVDAFSNGEGQRLSYECPYLYPDGGPARGAAPKGRMGVRAVVEERAEFFRNRYGRPPPIVDASVSYRHMDLEAGDTVQLTAPSLPRRDGGGRGLDSPGVILSKRIDDKSKVVELSVLMTGDDKNYRLFAPCAKIKQVFSDESELFVYLERNEFTDFEVRGIGQTDVEIVTSDGTYWEWLGIGAPLRFMSPSFANIYTPPAMNAWGDGFGNPWISFQPVPMGGHIPVIGEYVILAPAAFQLPAGAGASPLNIVAFFTTTDGTVVEPSNPPHHYYP